MRGGVARRVASDSGDMKRSATLNDDFRFELGREWRLYPEDAPRHAVWIMLNPSTADALVDDPTIRRCISFSQREGCGSMTVVNRFPMRATDPKALIDFADHPDFRVAMDLNVRTMQEVLTRAKHEDSLVICAWGAHSAYSEGAAAMIGWLGENAPTLHCLGTTKQGHPRHPLYLGASTPLEEFGVVSVG